MHVEVSEMKSKASASPSGDDPTARLEWLLKAARTHLKMDVGFISEFKNGRRVFRHVDLKTGGGEIEVGASDPLENSYCHLVAQGKIPKIVRDSAEHPITAALPITKTLNVGSYISTPIRLPDGSIYGTFCCYSSAADPFLTKRELSTLEAFAEVAGHQIQEVLDSGREHRFNLERIRAMLAAEDLDTVFQPALRLDTETVEFHEALARFRSDPYVSPDQWFALAAEVGLGPDLEMLAIRHALAGMRLLPPASSISLNTSPETILSPGFEKLFANVSLEKVILEITEHAAMGSYAEVLRILKPLRTRGLRLAIDDAGAGYSSFRHILDLQPEIIKLDMSLVRDIHLDPSRRALASALIHFTAEIGCELVAEGVETESELLALESLGVKIVQGFLTGRPEPAGDVTREAPSKAEVSGATGSFTENAARAF